MNREELELEILDMRQSNARWKATAIAGFLFALLLLVLLGPPATRKLRGRDPYGNEAALAIDAGDPKVLGQQMAAAMSQMRLTAATRNAELNSLEMQEELAQLQSEIAELKKLRAHLPQDQSSPPDLLESSSLVESSPVDEARSPAADRPHSPDEAEDEVAP